MSHYAPPTCPKCGSEIPIEPRTPVWWERNGDLIQCLSCPTGCGTGMLKIGHDEREDYDG